MPIKLAPSADLERLRRLWGAAPDAGAALPPEPGEALPDPAALLAALMREIAAALGPKSEELAIARRLLEDAGDPEAKGPRTIGDRVEAMFPPGGAQPLPEELGKMRDQMAKDLDDLEDVLEALKLGVTVRRSGGAVE